MKEYIEIIDELAEESLKTQSKEEWLEWLKGLRDELNIQIGIVEKELYR